MKSPNTIEMDEWLDALNEAGGYEAPPEGWKTATQIATLWDLRLSRTRDILRSLIAKGKAECRVFRVERRPVPHYRLKGAKK